MKPKILLIGENLDGSRFTTPARHVLDDVLREVGLSQANVAIVAPSMAAKEIVRQKPNVAVVLGDWAFKTCVPGVQLNSMTARGYLFNGITNSKVLVTIHPEQARKQWTPWRVLLSYDLQRAKEESHDPHISRPKREVIVIS